VGDVERGHVRFLKVGKKLPVQHVFEFGAHFGFSAFDVPVVSGQRAMNLCLGIERHFASKYDYVAFFLTLNGEVEPADSKLGRDWLARVDRRRRGGFA
jgi:hypothetical protein